MFGQPQLPTLWVCKIQVRFTHSISFIWHKIINFFLQLLRNVAISKNRRLSITWSICCIGRNRTTRATLNIQCAYIFSICCSTSISVAKSLTHNASNSSTIRRYFCGNTTQEGAWNYWICTTVHWQTDINSHNKMAVRVRSPVLAKVHDHHAATPVQRIQLPEVAPPISDQLRSA